MDLRDAVTLHQLALTAEGRAPATMRLYLLYQKRFLEYLDERHIPDTLEALGPLHVRAATEWFRERGLGQRDGQVAVQTFVNTLKTWANFLEQEGVWENSPLRRVKPVRVPKVLRKPYSETEVLALWGATRTTKTPTRDEALLLLLLDTGMRIGEACTLVLGDLHLDERYILVGLKGKGRQERQVPVGDPTKVGGGRTMRALRAWLRDRETMLEHWPQRRTEHVFLTAAGYQLTAGGAADVVKHLGKIAGVSNAIPHRCRHSFCSWYLTAYPGDELGLRRIVGHISNSVTSDYVHFSQATIAARAQRSSIVEALPAPKAAPVVEKRPVPQPVRVSPIEVAEPPEPVAPARKLSRIEELNAATAAAQSKFIRPTTTPPPSATSSSRPSDKRDEPLLTAWGIEPQQQHCPTPAARFCPACGYQRGGDDRFCAGCGRPVAS